MVTEGYKKKGGKNGPPTGPRPEPPKGQGKNKGRKNMKDLSVDQLEDLNTFSQNEGTEIGEVVQNLLDLYSKQPYISEDLFEKVVDELHGWHKFYKENTEWKTWEETVTFTELEIKE